LINALSHWMQKQRQYICYRYSVIALTLNQINVNSELLT